MLRLEFLFDRMMFFSQQSDPRMHQVALTSLFDLLDATERTDMKGSVLQDLERQRSVLLSLQSHPEVDDKRLTSMVAEIERVAQNLTAPGKTGQLLRENEWLTSLRGRLVMPGGGTQVDMPSFHAWQNRPDHVRAADLNRWMSSLMPLQAGISIVLGLLRESGHAEDAKASAGGYQQMLGGKTYQLLRVWVDAAKGVFPEMSANKYMVWIRFASQDGELKPQQVVQEVPFRLALCAL